MLSVPDLSAILFPSHWGFMEWYSCQNCLQVIIKKIKEAKNEGVILLEYGGNDIASYDGNNT